jgi:hypothetical protein
MKLNNTNAMKKFKEALKDIRQEANIKQGLRNPGKFVFFLF